MCVMFKKMFQLTENRAILRVYDVSTKFHPAFVKFETCWKKQAFLAHSIMHTPIFSLWFAWGQIFDRLLIFILWTLFGLHAAFPPAQAWFGLVGPSWTLCLGLLRGWPPCEITVQFAAFFLENRDNYRIFLFLWHPFSVEDNIRHFGHLSPHLHSSIFEQFRRDATDTSSFLISHRPERSL